MKYLLVVGFNCDVYRLEPRARIFVGNKLIDEIFIKNFPGYKQHIDKEIKVIKKLLGIEKNHMQPLTEDENLKIYNFYYDKTKNNYFYELDIDNNIKEINLSIEIFNNDNNYNNGFMTKNTLINVRNFTLLPMHESIYLKFYKILKNRKKLENCNWFYSKYNELFEFTQQLEWRGDNGQFFKNIVNYNLGGSGVISCNLIKKYKIFMPKLLKPYRFTFQEHLIKVMFDKYKQHAN
jgi:hypothetical protein